MAFMTNVVRRTWCVVTQDGKRRNEYIVEAESEETAKLKAPKDETVISVELLDGR